MASAMEDQMEIGVQGLGAREMEHELEIGIEGLDG